MNLIGKHGEPIILSENSNNTVTVDIFGENNFSRGELPGNLEYAISYMLKRGCKQQWEGMPL